MEAFIPACNRLAQNKHGHGRGCGASMRVHAPEVTITWRSSSLARARCAQVQPFHALEQRRRVAEFDGGKVFGRFSRTPSPVRAPTTQETPGIADKHP